MKQDRDSVREAVFSRDNHKCVIPWCHKEPDDAHHLIERKLWGDKDNGGYLMDNMVSVCEPHHRLCENNTILPQSLREWSGITTLVLPSCLDNALDYDKWGKELKLPNRQAIKYPHTPYLPFSPNADERDVAESGYISISSLLNKPLSLSLKMDGSNVVLTRDYVAARNGYDATHVSFDMVKQIHAQLRFYIPEDIMVFGEWLYAKHSIHYTGELGLLNYLQVFGAYNKNMHIWMGSIEFTKLCADIIRGTDRYHPLLSGVDDVKGYNNLESLWHNKVFTNEKELKSTLISLGNKAIASGHEGIVVRSAYPFHHSRWGENIAKYVRADHIQTDKHWMHQPIVRNEVKK